MSDNAPSLYEVLLGNFSGELDLHQVDEQDQHVLSVLDNLQRLFNTRAGSLAHLPDLGLPDLNTVLDGLAGSAQTVCAAMSATVLTYEPRLSDFAIDRIEHEQPGHLEFVLSAHLKNGDAVSFGTTLAVGGRVLVRHLKRQHYLPAS